MWSLAIEILILLAGFVVLVKGADLLVDGGVALGRRLRVSELFIGLTVISFGTSAPELFVNGVAALRGEHALVFGNVIGSNIFNTSLVLGVGALIYPLAVRARTARLELPFSALAALLLLALVNDGSFSAGADDVLGRGDGVLLLALFALFLVYTGLRARADAAQRTGEVAGTSASLARTLVAIAVGAAALPLGGHLVVESATRLAIALGVSQTLVGLTVVAAGTSLPELAATSVAAYRRRADLAIGNVVGSNIFNLLLILGVSACLRPVSFPSALNLDLGVYLGASALVLGAVTIGSKGRLTRAAATLLLLLFVSYLVFLATRELGWL